MKYYLNILRNYADFRGRTGRREFWYFIFYHYIITSISIRFMAPLFLSGLRVEYFPTYFIVLGILGSIYCIGTLIPSIAVCVRRMHDVGKSGWFILVPIYNLVLYLQKGDTIDELPVEKLRKGKITDKLSTKNSLRSSHKSEPSNLTYFFYALDYEYGNFSGRTNRTEFWFFVLFNFIIQIFFNMMIVFSPSPLIQELFFTLSLSYGIGVLIPSLAISVRRMHDIGKSGWYALIPIYNLILCTKEGDKYENQYGKLLKYNRSF